MGDTDAAALVVALFPPLGGEGLSFGDLGASHSFFNNIQTACHLFIACPFHLFHLRQKPWNSPPPPDSLSGMDKISGIVLAILHEAFLGGAAQRSTKGLGTSLAVLIQTLLVWRYSRIASAPFSRPRPLCL